MNAFTIEAQALSRAVADLSPDEWNLPTRCAPWTVRELLGHVRAAIAWLPGMLAAPQPDRPEVSATEYYRPDHRFTPQTNAARIALAREHADEDFTATWKLVDKLCQAEAPDRVVRTRHGDAMLLSEFMVTRVVELAIHGIDLADALGRPPWLTPQAADVVTELLLGPGRTAAIHDLGWDQPGFLRRATGRQPLKPEEAEQVNRLGLRWLTLG